MDNLAIILEIFMVFLKIGAFSFGGGYAMLPLMEKEIIVLRGWLSSGEFIDIVAISEMTPGPLAINAATFLGYRVSGTLGSVVATIAVVLPSFIIMITILIFINRFRDSKYIDWTFRGIRPVVLGLIISAAVSVSFSSFIDFKSILIGLGIFYIVAIRKVNPISAIIIAGSLGLILY